MIINWQNKYDVGGVSILGMIFNGIATAAIANPADKISAQSGTLSIGANDGTTAINATTGTLSIG